MTIDNRDLFLIQKLINPFMDSFSKSIDRVGLASEYHRLFIKLSQLNKPIIILELLLGNSIFDIFYLYCWNILARGHQFNLVLFIFFRWARKLNCQVNVGMFLFRETAYQLKASQLQNGVQPVLSQSSEMAIANH